MKKRIISIGDIMILLYSEDVGSLRYIETLKKDFAGAEINFLIGCSRMGLECSMMSRLGKDSFGEYIYHQMISERIDVSHVQFDVKRPTAIFIKERMNNGLFGISYYREGTAGTEYSVAGIDYNFLSTFNVFYFTGIFPAISKNNLFVLTKILEHIKKQSDTLVVFDPNIRLKLFQHDYKQARLHLENFLSYADVVLLGDTEAKILLGEDEPEKVFKMLELRRVKISVMKRAEKGSVGWDGKNIYHEPIVKTKVVDACGAGDAFNVGFMYGYLMGKDMKTSLHYGSVIASQVIAAVSDNRTLPYLEEFQNIITNKQKIYR